MLKSMRRFRALAAMALVLGAFGQAARAGETTIAVATNFTDAAKEIGAAFEKATGHKAIFSFGSTGQLYAQIGQNAPFEVFLAADQARPQKAVDEGLAVHASRVTYATGRIVLFSRDKTVVKGKETLTDSAITKVAIANPVTAPYGTAAVEAMQALGVYDALSAKLVKGSNIAQTYQFVATGNAEIGFVALSQIAAHDEGSRWLVPAELYKPIAQDAVLLTKGQGNDAARAFMDFLMKPEAKAIKEKYGYGASDSA
jgi:molybdate transport system substrate-binding protein